jgi:diguanylate cyclase (GGDEF)-like protein
MADSDLKTVPAPEMMELGQDSSQQHAYLIVISAKSAAGIGRMFKLDKSETVLGRGGEAQFRLEEEGISRKHAKVVSLGEGRFQLVDLGSTNGTFLNGLKVNAAPLYDGDKIQIGPNTVLKFSIQDQLEEAYQRSIYESVTRDGLTHLYNKKFLLETLRKEFAYCLRNRVPLSLVMFSVDSFKRINDEYGHQGGDFVLTRVGQQVNDLVRTEDLVARYDGSVFALMQRECKEELALVYAERCRREVAHADFIFNGNPIRVTLSVGVAELLDSDFAQPEELLAAADRYRHRAIHAGCNRVDARALSGP